MTDDGHGIRTMLLGITLAILGIGIPVVVLPTGLGTGVGETLLVLGAIVSAAGYLGPRYRS